MRLSNKAYDILKVIQKILVLMATFYVKIAEIWDLPYGDQISKTCLECAAVLIGILEISTVRYKNDLLEQNTWGELVEDYVPPVDVVDHEMDEGEG